MTLRAASSAGREGPPPVLAVAPEAIILDFDGVLAPRNTELLRDACCALVRRHRDFDPGLFQDLFAALVPFPLEPAMGLLLSALGLTALRAELGQVLATVDGGIDDALPFLDECRRRGVALHVLSSGHAATPKYRRVRELLGDGAVHADPDLSKLDPEHYRRHCRARRIDPARAWYIDDCPLALQSAKAVGLTTIRMANAVFGEEQARPLACIDAVARDWPSACALLAASSALSP